MKLSEKLHNEARGRFDTMRIMAENGASALDLVEVELSSALAEFLALTASLKEGDRVWTEQLAESVVALLTDAAEGIGANHMGDRKAWNGEGDYPPGVCAEDMTCDGWAVAPMVMGSVCDDTQPIMIDPTKN